MKVKDKIQAQYNKGEINFKEMNKLYKKYEGFLDEDSDRIEALKDINDMFPTSFKMEDLTKAIIDYTKMSVLIPKPIKPSFEKGKAFEITRPVLPSMTKRENDEIDKLFWNKQGGKLI